MGKMEVNLRCRPERADYGRCPFIGKAGDLQRQVILIGPEPGHGIMRRGGADHVFRHKCSLILRVAPGFEPDTAMAVERMGEGAAVAGSEDVGIAGA